jgi:hypothetical protein
MFFIEIFIAQFSEYNRAGNTLAKTDLTRVLVSPFAMKNVDLPTYFVLNDLSDFL